MEFRLEFFTSVEVSFALLVMERTRFLSFCGAVFPIWCNGKGSIEGISGDFRSR